MIQLETIVLPPDLWWVDETEYTPVEQISAYTLGGALLVEVGVRLAGRPITLVGSEQVAWVPRSTVLALQTLAADPAKEMTLILHGQTFTVMFRHDDGPPVAAEPVVRISPPAATDYYSQLVIRLMEI